MKVDQNLENTNNRYTSLYDNSKEECDFAIVASTHGFWILKLNIAYGEQIIQEYREEARKFGKPLANFQMIQSTAFREKIANPAFTQGTGASAENLRAFMNELYQSGGKITKLQIVTKKKEKKDPYSINSVTLAALV